MHATPKVVLVTPVWNDSVRLSKFGPTLANALAVAQLDVHWVVSDDGSGKAEQEKVRALVSTFSEIYGQVAMHPCTQRMRKGGAIYEAWDKYPTAEWYAFVDADGAINAETTVRLIQLALETGKSTVGVRVKSPGERVQRTFGRNLVFKLFNQAVRILLKLPASDTQCGVKVVHGDAYREISGSLQEKGFIFDVELLLALAKAGRPVNEIPISWNEISGGKVSPIREGFQMLKALLRIRKRWH